MAGEVQKEYLCVVDGYTSEPRKTKFMVDAPIQRHGVSFAREIGSSRKDSKPAVTAYTILDKNSEKEMMLLHAAPETGRTHQIRLHAKKSCLPIVGDDLYNEKEYVRVLAQSGFGRLLVSRLLCLFCTDSLKHFSIICADSACTHHTKKYLPQLAIQHYADLEMAILSGRG